MKIQPPGADQQVDVTIYKPNFNNWTAEVVSPLDGSTWTMHASRSDWGYWVEVDPPNGREAYLGTFATLTLVREAMAKLVLGMITLGQPRITDPVLADFLASMDPEVERIVGLAAEFYPGGPKKDVQIGGPEVLGLVEKLDAMEPEALKTSLLYAIALIAKYHATQEDER